jgi:hypothetical protein
MTVVIREKRREAIDLSTGNSLVLLGRGRCGVELELRG